MATQTLTTYTDDITGAPGARPRTYVIDGETFHIDLTDTTHALIAHSMIALLTVHARRTPESTRVIVHARTSQGRARRDKQIKEMYAKERNYSSVGRAFKLSGARISQIVNG